jgi:hypothetical protein
MPVRVGGTATLRMAGVGGVGTEPAYRRAGLAGRVYARTMEEIHADGYSCVGLYTGTQIVAHRLYRRFGFVDVMRARAAAKLLDPVAFAEARFADLVRSNTPPELASLRSHLRLDLPHSAPIHLHLNQGEVTRVAAPPQESELTLRLSEATLLQLFRNSLPIGYAEAAGLVRWEGKEEHWRLLAAAFAARHQVIHEGG